MNASEPEQKRAVIVDDDASLVAAMSVFLRRKGYEVLSYGQATFCPLYTDRRCHCPEGYYCTDLLITDINQKVISGKQFIDQILAGGCRIENIAVMSVVWKPAERDYFRNLECTILTKPFKMKELESWLTKCERHELRECRLIQLDKTE